MSSPSPKSTRSSRGDQQTVRVPFDLRKYAAELVELEKLSARLRRDGWFTAADLAESTGWTQTKCACHCARQTAIKRMESQMALDRAASGRVIETRFYRLLN